MHYVQESLAPGEKILKISTYHWIYVFKSFVGAVMFFVLALIVMFFAVIYHYYDPLKLPPWMILKAGAELAMTDYIRAFWHTNIIARIGAFMLIFMGALQVGASMLVVATTEIAVTNKRIVLKRGLISRIVEQMRTDFIESDDVHQTVLGRILDYGWIKIHGTGTDSIVLPRFTTDPIGFRRAIQMARNMSVQQAEQALQQVQQLPPTMPPRPIPTAVSPAMPPNEAR